MNSLILCEGKTDAILLGFYLTRTCGWETTKNIVKGKPTFKNMKKNQFTRWYENNGNFLLIFAVGGKNNFGNVLDEYILPILSYPIEDSFQKIAIISDRDNDDAKSALKNHEILFKEINISAVGKQWTNARFLTSFKEERIIQTLSIVIPTDKQGALEVVLLEVLCEDEYNGIIVEKCREFVDHIQPNAKKYISTDRLVLKAHLSVVFAVISPEKFFEFIGELLREVPWEKSQILKDCFGELWVI
jgi:hypothetical protein